MLEEQNNILIERSMKEKQLRMKAEQRCEKAEQELEQFKLKYPELFCKQQTNPQNHTSANEAPPSGNPTSSLLHEDQLPEIALMDTFPDKKKKTEVIF